MKCPICDFQHQGGSARCPRCQTALTFWINQDEFSQSAYSGGLQALRSGNRELASEFLLRACVSAPDVARNVAAYGRVLAQCGRYEEAARVLKRACQLEDSEPNRAAMERAKSLGAASGGAKSSEVSETQRQGEGWKGALRAIPLTDRTEANPPGDSGTNASRWELVFEIEKNWEIYEPVAQIALWQEPTDASESAPLNYLRGLYYLTHDDLDSARESFRLSALANDAYANADIRWLALEQTATARDAVKELLSRGRTLSDMNGILEEALNLAGDATPDLGRELVLLAMTLAVDTSPDSQPAIPLPQARIERYSIEDRVQLWKDLIDRVSSPLTWYHLAMGLQSGTCELRQRLAIVLSRVPKDLESALQQIGKATERFKDDAEAVWKLRLLRAHLMVEGERYSEAKALLKQLGDQDPGATEVLSLLARCENPTERNADSMKEDSSSNAGSVIPAS